MKRLLKKANSSKEDVINCIDYAIIGDGSLTQELFDKIAAENPDCIIHSNMYSAVIVDDFYEDYVSIFDEDQDRIPEEFDFSSIRDKLEKTIIDSMDEFPTFYFKEANPAIAHTDPLGGGVRKAIFISDTTCLDHNKLMHKYNIEKSDLQFHPPTWAAGFSLGVQNSQNVLALQLYDYQTQIYDFEQD